MQYWRRKSFFFHNSAFCFFHVKDYTHLIFQSFGVNAADLKKLKAVGICTVKGLKMVTKKKLSAIKGLSDAKVDKIREALLKSCGDGSVFCTALEVAVKRKNCFHIATGNLWFIEFFYFSDNFLKKEQNNAVIWRIFNNKATYVF